MTVLQAIFGGLWQNNKKEKKRGEERRKRKREGKRGKRKKRERGEEHASREPKLPVERASKNDLHCDLKGYPQHFLAHSSADSIEISQVRDRECDIIWHQQCLTGERSNQSSAHFLLSEPWLALSSWRHERELRLDSMIGLYLHLVQCYALRTATSCFCVLLTAWKEWWRIESIQFLFCHTHCLLSCNGSSSCMVLLPHDKESIQLGKNMLPITFFTSQLIEVYLISKNWIGSMLSPIYFNSMNWMFWMEILSNCPTSLWSRWYYVSMMQRITWKNCHGFLSRGWTLSALLVFALSLSLSLSKRAWHQSACLPHAQLVKIECLFEWHAWSIVSKRYASCLEMYALASCVEKKQSCALISLKWVSGSFWLGLVPVPSPWSCGDGRAILIKKFAFACWLVVWMRLFLLLVSCSLFLLSHCCRSTSAWLLVFQTWLTAHYLSFIERKSKVSMMVDGGGSRMTFDSENGTYVRGSSHQKLMSYL